jgi:TonB family protein
MVVLMILRLSLVCALALPLSMSAARAETPASASTSTTATVYDLDDDDAPAAAPALEPKQVSEVVGKNSWAVSDCYSRNAIRSQTGRMTVEFRIKGDGTVSEAKLESSDLHNTALEACVVEVVKKMRFPALNGPETVTTFPFIF